MSTFDRRFGAVLGTVLEVQAVGVTGITTLSLSGVKLVATGTVPKRFAVVDITIDGDTFEFEIDFTDEVFNTRTIEGSTSDAPTPL